MWWEALKNFLAVISCQKEYEMTLDLASMQIMKEIDVHLPESPLSLAGLGLWFWTDLCKQKLRKFLKNWMTKEVQCLIRFLKQE